ncbi:MAG: hypothetical protein JST92_18080 [Deltaproteobacteria bacterium]|nr:hypothetical protein [Deltaproteobacteria bacterium]
MLALALTLLAVPIEVSGAATVETQAGTDAITNERSETANLSATLQALGRLEGGAQLSLLDVPRLTWASPVGTAPQNLSVFNAGTAALELTWPRTRLRLTESYGFGKQDFSVLSQSLQADPANPTAPPTTGRVPEQRFLPHYTTSTALALDAAHTRAFRTTATVTFTAGGGLGTAGRTALPWQQTLGGTLLANLLVSSLDTASAQVNSTVSRSDDGTQTLAVGGSIGWRRLLAPTTSGALTLGVAVLINHAPQSATGAAIVSGDLTTPVPTLSASLTHGGLVGATRFAFALDGKAEPAVDFLTGALYLRGSGRLTGSFSPQPSLTFSATLLGDRILSGDLRGAWGGGAELAGTLRFTELSGLRLSARSAIVTPAAVLLPDAPVPRLWNVVASVYVGGHDRF